MTTFKERHDFESRVQESSRVISKYTERIPVIVEKSPHSDVPGIDKCKYLVPKDLTVGQFIYVLRKRLELKPSQSIFIFINNNLPPASALMSSIYKEHSDSDGFLYVLYSGESAFGTDF